MLAHHCIFVIYNYHNAYSTSLYCVLWHAILHLYTHVLDVDLSSMHTDAAFKAKYEKAFRESCEGVTFVLEDA